MHILTVLYGQPDDPAAFDKYYEQTHVPLANKIPDCRSFTYRHVATLDGSKPPYHLIAELAFDSLESLQASMGGPEGQAAAGDVPNFATGGVTMLVAFD
ncbi:EthD family reductase [Actinomycetospora endophytica]|uniref:EthD family reductase n=1 Tax=Actinomycetospora endophytica TaxID=2291215 RepID=A0ABS8PE42_9PSEU|nr:EthD family reductase [Actinomycetospora endophytica]MCD2196547.1 EthD family reductase [Actinomycetospora endophytica]